MASFRGRSMRLTGIAFAVAAAALAACGGGASVSAPVGTAPSIAATGRSTSAPSAAVSPASPATQTATPASSTNGYVPPGGLPPGLTPIASPYPTLAPTSITQSAPPISATPVGNALAKTGTSFVLDSQGRQWTYDYFVPPKPIARPQLVVALHGCSETPPDFEEGTRWFEDAAAAGYIVIMPRHITGGYGGSTDDNLENCWQFWNEHTRGTGEPAIVRAQVASIEARYPTIDTSRVYAVGMSGGAFFSVILAVTYPDVFAGVGVQSGGEYDPCKAWSEEILDDDNLNDPGMSCYQATNTGTGLPDPTAQGDEAYADLVADGGPTSGAPVPAVFMHGDADSLVGFRNEALAFTCLARFDDRYAGAGNAYGSFNATVQSSHAWNAVIPGGWPYDQYVADDGRLEWWVIHGMNHAWSGGTQDASSDASGGLDSHNYNDPRGPGTTQLMRHFLFSFQRM